jgi:hypothetical protein
MVIMIGVFITVFVLTAVGPERRGVAFAGETASAA